MLPNIKNIYKPETLAEAWRLLSGKNNKVVVVGGTTHLALSKNREITGLMDLSLLGWNRIETKDKKIKIGASVTITNLLDNAKVKKFASGLLYSACYCLASAPLRNMITVGGNLALKVPWSNLPVALLALNSEVVLVSKTGEKKLSIEEFKRYKIAPDEIIKEVLIEKIPKGYKAVFKKFSLTDFDYPYFNLAVNFRKEKNKITDIKIAVGRITAQFTRCYALEERLKNILLNSESVQKALSGLEKEIVVTPNYRASAEYRMAVLKTEIERIILF